MVGWQELLQERVNEAVCLLGGLPGVTGVIVGGSVGRGEAWPLSDIDLLPIGCPEIQPAISQQQAQLVDWWAASGRAQTLDVGWLAFTTAEAEASIAAGPVWAAGKMTDRRWFHGLDKMYGGYGADQPAGLAEQFVRWATAQRFTAEVITARVAIWQQQVRTSAQDAFIAHEAGDTVAATLALREAARSLRLVLIEQWGERLGSMGREWTRFERLADQHQAADVARQIASLADALPIAQRSKRSRLPLWLRERIERARLARRAVGEIVSPAENARDQVAAFRIHVSRHRPDLSGSWLGLPDPDLPAKLTQLQALVTLYCQPEAGSSTATTA